MTVITTVFSQTYPPPRRQRQLQLIFYFFSGFFPKSPQDRFLISTEENSLIPYRNSFIIFLNDWLQAQRCNFINKEGLSSCLACRAHQFALNIKTSFSKIGQSWTENFVPAHCRALDKTNVFANYLLSLIPAKPLAPLEAGEPTKGEQLEEVVIHSNLEPYINFHLNNPGKRFFLLNACNFILNLFHKFPTNASLLFYNGEITFSSKEIGEFFRFDLKISQYFLTSFSHLHCRNKFRKISLASHKSSQFFKIPSQIL
ncbi:hypothetical protein P9112_014011 [Eukaryota sp. TZLM1-RC]